MKALVIGAGIGGLATAASLCRAGVETEVYERAAELRPAGSALALTGNARVALRTFGIDLPVGQEYDALHLRTATGRLIRTVSFDAIGTRVGAQSVAVHRADLQRALREAAADVPIALGARATRFRTSDTGVEVDFADGRVARGDVLIGADGYHSVVRRQLVGAEPPNEAGYVCWLATPDFCHPAMPPGYVGHYWGRGQRFGLIDLGGGRCYWWGTLNMPPEQARHWQGGKSEIERAYAGWADEVRAAVDATPDGTILAAPAHDRQPLRRWGSGPVTLLGDAAHPMLPSLAQGAAMAIEDAVVLAQSLSTGAPPVRALRAYEDLRRARTRKMLLRARSLSRIEQFEHPLARAVRNAYIRWLPAPLLDRRNLADLTFPGSRP